MSKKKHLLNAITLVEFYEKDLAIRQENDYVLLDKSEILELAKIIQNDMQALELAKWKQELAKGKNSHA